MSDNKALAIPDDSELKDTLVDKKEAVTKKVENIEEPKANAEGENNDSHAKDVREEAKIDKLVAEDEGKKASQKPEIRDHQAEDEAKRASQKPEIQEHQAEYEAKRASQKPEIQDHQAEDERKRTDPHAKAECKDPKIDE